MSRLHVVNAPQIDGNPWQCSCYYDHIIKWINWQGYGNITNKDRPGEPRCVVGNGIFADQCIYTNDEESLQLFFKASSPPPETKKQYCDQKAS